MFVISCLNSSKHGKEAFNEKDTLLWFAIWVSDFCGLIVPIQLFWLCWFVLWCSSFSVLFLIGQLCHRCMMGMHNLTVIVVLLPFSYCCMLCVCVLPSTYPFFRSVSPADSTSFGLNSSSLIFPLFSSEF